MRHSITLLAFTLSTCSIAQWSPRPSGTINFLRDIYFPTPDLGFAVGDSGTIVRTQDAGETWAVVHEDGFNTWYSVHFPSPTTGYAAGGAFGTGIVLKTTDAGVTWTTVFNGAWQDFRSVHFVDTLTGYVGGAGYVFRTTDGGTSWNYIPGVDANTQVWSISFPSIQVGFFIGGPDFTGTLLKTTDGGTSVQAITNGFQSLKEACQFLNDSVGFMGGWYEPLLVKTTDRGITWTSIWPYSDGVWDLHFVDEDHGFTVGWGGGWGSIYSTQNGGTDWSYQYQDATHDLEALHMVDAQTGFAAGSGGLILKTTNGGNAIGELNLVRPALRIHPNPASDVITMQLSGSAAMSDLSIELLDARGQSVMRASVKAENGSIRSTLPRALSAGSYTLLLRSGNDRIGSAPVTIVR